MLENGSSKGRCVAGADFSSSYPDDLSDLSTLCGTRLKLGRIVSRLVNLDAPASTIHASVPDMITPNIYDPSIMQMTLSNPNEQNRFMVRESGP